MVKAAQRRPPPVFPAKQALFSGRQLAFPDLLAIDTLVSHHGPLAGYLVAEEQRDAMYLLFLKGKPYSAGLYHEGRFSTLSLREYFSRLGRQVDKSRSFDLLAVDPAVLLLIAVLFQNRPVLSVTSDLANPVEVLGKVEASGRDAVIALAEGPLHHVVFCKAGVPVRFHTAAGVATPDEATLAEAISVFCLERAGGDPMTLEVYDDLAVSPAADHGLPLARYAAQGGQVLRYELVRFEGTRVSETQVFQIERCVIGRGDSADLRLDDHAVSREHAAIEWRKGELLLSDLGSDNGTRVNKRLLTEPHALQAGDEIELGRSRLGFRPGPAGGFFSEDETQQLHSGEQGPRLVFEGTSLAIGGDGLVIGSDAGADITVSGLGIRPHQTRVFREQDGQHWLEHLGGMRQATVNGERAERILLSSGDTIRLAGEIIRFFDFD